MELRQALINNQVASAGDVDEALARQTLYGGDVITNLLELTAIEEGVAQRSLAEAYQMPAAPGGELPYASAAAIELVPRDIATSLGVYPYSLKDGVLSVIASEPLSDSAGVELGFALKVELQGLIALAPRVKQAIARDYAFALDRRTQKAVARLERRAKVLSSRAPNPLTQAPSLSELPRPNSVTPAAFPMAWSESLTPTGGQLLAETVEQPEVVLRQHLAAGAAGSEAANPRPATTAETPDLGSSPARRRGPYTAAQAKRDLSESRTPKQVLTVYFDYAAQYFDHAAAFTLKANEAQLRHTRGLPVPKIGQRFQLSNSPALSRLSESRQWVSTKLSEDDAQLAGALGTKALTQGMLLPVRVKERCVVILYGAFTNSDVELEDVGELLAFEALVAEAFSHSIRVRKTVAPGPARGLPSGRPDQKYARPSAEDRARAVATLLTGTNAAAGAPVPAVPGPAAPRPPDPTIRQSGNTIPVRATEGAEQSRGVLQNADASRAAPQIQQPVATRPSASSPMIAEERLPPVRSKGPPPLTGQPPGAYPEESEEVRDSGWDFDL